MEWHKFSEDSDCIIYRYEPDSNHKYQLSFDKVTCTCDYTLHQFVRNEVMMTPQDAKDNWISHSSRYGHWEYEHPCIDIDILEFISSIFKELNGSQIEQAEMHPSFERSYKTLKMLRIEAGLSSKAVSLKFKKSPSWLTKVEKGQINLSNDTYNQMRDYYLMILNRTAKVNAENDLNKRQFLVKENKMLRELLMLYIPTNQNDLEILLEQRKKKYHEYEGRIIDDSKRIDN